MRRPPNTTWPTWRRKAEERRRWPTPPDNTPTPQPSTDELARRLVARGLADPLILGPTPFIVRRQEAKPWH